MQVTVVENGQEKRLERHGKNRDTDGERQKTGAPTAGPKRPRKQEKGRAKNRARVRTNGQCGRLKRRFEEAGTK